MFGLKILKAFSLMLLGLVNLLIYRHTTLRANLTVQDLKNGLYFLIPLFFVLTWFLFDSQSLFTITLTEDGMFT
mgnify:CR=1 FL=1